MRQVTRKGLISVAAAGGVIALGGGYAQADSVAAGGASNSPGVLSGNSVQAPVHVPVNACGNTVDVVGLLNPAMGNSCANVSGSGGGSQAGGGSQGGGSQGGGSQAGGGSHGGGSQGGGSHSGGGSQGGGSHSGGGAHAGGGTSNSPGVGSGNNVQAPIDVPVNACGNSITIGGLLNPSFGNDCANAPEVPRTPETPQTPETPEQPQTPETPHTPRPSQEPNTPGAQTLTPPKGDEQLAETGMGALDILAPAGAGLLLAGAVLYRRSRAAA